MTNLPVEKTWSNESPRTDYNVLQRQGSGDGLDPNMWSDSKGVSDVFRSLLPWFIALLLGVLTAITGSAIALFSDFLGDTRFGFCYGIFLADRNRCCGGSENVDFLEEMCTKPASLSCRPGVFFSKNDVLEPSAKFRESMSDNVSMSFWKVRDDERVEPVRDDGDYGDLSCPKYLLHLVTCYILLRIGDDGVRWIPWAHLLGVGGSGSEFLSWFMYTFASLMFTGLAAYLVYEYAPTARGSGIPEVKAAVSGYDLPLSFTGSCLLIKSLGLSLAVGAGLSLGKEGHCHIVGRDRFVTVARFELGSVRSLSQRTLLLSFLAAFSASFTLKSLNLTGANKLTLFALSLPTNTARKEWISWEMFAFFLTGVLGGFGGALFVTVNIWCTSRRREALKKGHLWFLPESLVSGRQRGTLNVLECILLDAWLNGN
eukprot:g1233.t1